MARRVFMTAAEASGDQAAAMLARSLKSLDPDIQLEGIGGPKMADAGVVIHHETVLGAAMGAGSVFRIREFSRWKSWLRAYYQTRPPDLHICVDSSAMNLPFARLVKQFNVPVMYYIAPQIWASRERRAKRIRRDVDQIAAILPFEEQYLTQLGVRARFVGHPLFDTLPRDRTHRDGPRFPDAPPVIGVVPGSRRAEVHANLPHLLEVIDCVRQEFSGAKCLMPTTQASDGLVRQIVGDRPDIEIVMDGFDHVMPQCDLCLTKSGTSTLHTAAWGVPMIVVYRLNPLAWHLVARWLVNTRKIALVNILAGNEEVVPEFIPWYGSNEPVAQCAIQMLKEPWRLDEQRKRLAEVVAPLDRPGASMNAAKMALEMLNAEERE